MSARRCELFVSDHVDAGDETCSDSDHAKALRARRAAKCGPRWSPIVTGRDAGGDRDFLDGEPINCGRSLLLQTQTTDYDDFGGISGWNQTGVRVRYETDHGGRNGGRRVVLYTEVGGHSFTTIAGPEHRFRWPGPRRDGT